MPFDLLEKLKQELPVIRAAPVTFIALMGIAFGGGFGLSTWYYSGQINLLQSRVDEQAERLGINLPYQTPYAKLTNRELKTAVQDLVGKLKVFASRADEFPALQVQEIVDADKEWALSRAKNEQEKEQILRKYVEVYTGQYNLWLTARAQHYEQQFKSQTLGLRDELLRRLNIRPEQNTVNYDSLLGARPITTVAEDLQRLGNLLPDKQS